MLAPLAGTPNQLLTAGPVLQVENIALLANAPDNSFVGVNMYCADDAASYNAPTNMRASQIVQRCGKPLDVSSCHSLPCLMQSLSAPACSRYVLLLGSSAATRNFCSLKQTG